jgi:hypothetical protein
MLPLPDALRRILEAGLLAPSAENKHYLAFRCDDDSVDVMATDMTSWAAQPHRRMLALLSYGAVVQNLALRSAELGYALGVEWGRDLLATGRVARLRWDVSAATADPLCHAIEGRHTNRRFYSRAALPAPALERLAAAAHAVPRTRLLWLAAGADRRAALQAIRRAETERFRRRALHDELFGAVRFELGWKQTADEWLPPGALEVEPPMRAGFALLRHWPVMRAAGWLGLHHALGVRAGYLPCALAPQLGLMLAEGSNEPLANLQAGSAFQRVWLAAAAEGLALQPMAAVTALLRQTPGGGWVDARVQAELARLVQPFCRAASERPYLFFRLGQAAVPSVTASRLPLHHYLR